MASAPCKQRLARASPQEDARGQQPLAPMLALGARQGALERGGIVVEKQGGAEVLGEVLPRRGAAVAGQRARELVLGLAAGVRRRARTERGVAERVQMQIHGRS